MNRNEIAAANEELCSLASRAGVIPVVAVESAEAAVPLAKALAAGGLPVVEIVFRTAAAAEAIAAIRREVPDAVVGAGTLLTPWQVRAAKDAGASFGVAPGFDPAIVAAVADAALPFCPGVSTASELSQAMTAGFRFVKFFPAEAAGGVAFLKSLAAAFRFAGAKFMPTGGVKLSNLASYLAVPDVAACGGTWLAPKDAVAAGDFAAIERLAREASDAARAAKTGGCGK